jgi:hypothetical protein
MTTTSPLAERDRLVAERAATEAAVKHHGDVIREALDEIKVGEIEVAAAYQHAARGTAGESPEKAEGRLDGARQRQARAEKAVEESYRAQRQVDGELSELYVEHREAFAAEAEEATTAFVKWRTKAAPAVTKAMAEGRKLELDAQDLWNPLALALQIEPPRISQVAAISNKARQLAVDVPRPAEIAVDGEADPVSEVGPAAGETVWIVYPNGQLDQCDVGTPSWDRAVEAGAEITDAPEGAA